MSTISNTTFLNADHYITSKYGYRTMNGKKKMHYGVDYGCNCKSIPIYALEAGQVYSCGYEKGGAGYYIWVKYPRINKRFLYCHMREATKLKKGDTVRLGTLLGYTGTTGNSTGIHLHLGVRDLTTNTYEDPEAFSKKYDAMGSEGVQPTRIKYVVNTPYLRVRFGPGTSYRQIRFEEMSKNAQQQILKFNHGTKHDCFPKGVEFDALEIRDGWGRTYSGWLCLKYCKKG